MRRTGPGGGLLTAKRKTLRIIQCRIGDQIYALDMDWVRSVQRADRLRRKGGTMLLSRGEGTQPFPGEPCGWLVSRRGELPVYDLAVMLGMSPARIRPDPIRGRSNPFERVVVLDAPVDRGVWQHVQEWGVLVDSVSQVVHLEPGQVSSLGDADVLGVRNRFSGLVRVDGSMMLCLQPGFLFPGTESASADDFTAATRQKGRPVVTRPCPAEVKPGNGSDSRSNQAGHRRILLFSLPGGQDPEADPKFAMSISQIPEILEPQPLIPLPGAPPYVRGLIDWRQRPVMLVDLGERLGLERKAESLRLGKHRIIIARDRLRLNEPQEAVGMSHSGPGPGFPDRGVLVGILSDPDVRVITLPEDSRISEPDIRMDLSAVRAAVEIEGRTVVIPDLSGILGLDRDCYRHEEPILSAHGAEA
jgi:chemotaxis signal transduction protein